MCGRPFFQGNISTSPFLSNFNSTHSCLATQVGTLIIIFTTLHQDILHLKYTIHTNMGFFKAADIRHECDKAAQILKSFVGMFSIALGILQCCND